MRSRYTAYVLGDGDHLFRTWHPRTRTDDADPDPRVRWEGLEVLDVVDGGADDAEGVVEFRARWVSADDGPTRRGELHERSRLRATGRALGVRRGHLSPPVAAVGRPSTGLPALFPVGPALPYSSDPDQGDIMARARTRLARGVAAAVGVVGLLSLSGLAAAAPGDPGTPRYTAGSAGAGDSYFPLAGNGGYDVLHYGLAIDYAPPAATVPATPLPSSGTAAGRRDDRPGRHRGPRPLQPRPAGDDRLGDDDQRKPATGIAPPATSARGRRRGLLARPGRCRSPVGAHGAAAAEAQGGPVRAGRGHLRRRRPPGPPTSRTRCTAG